MRRRLHCVETPNAACASRSIPTYEFGRYAGKRLLTPCDLSSSERSTFRIHLGSFWVKRATLCSMKVGFTPRQVTRLTGVPYSTLNLWAKKGLIQPSIAAGTGSGSERVYSFSDLVALKVAFALRRAGVTTSSLEKVVQFLRKNEGMEKPLAEARLVVSGRDVLVVKSEHELVSALSKPGQSYLSFVVDLPRTLGELAEVAEATSAFAVGLAHPEHSSLGSRKQSVSVRERRKRKDSQKG
jgi:DNA-binding transcriptional MerR regulator